MSGKSYTYSQVVDAVLKFGSNQWFHIGLHLGFIYEEIISATHDKPTDAGKLQIIINWAAEAVGDEELAELLLKACANIPQPIIGQVEHYLDPTYDPKAGMVTIEGSASEIQKSGAAFLVQPATRTSEADQVVEDKEIVKMAGNIKAIKMKANDIFGELPTVFIWQRKTDVIDGPLPPDKQTDPVMAKPDPGNGTASGKAEATPTVAEFEIKMKGCGSFSQASEFNTAVDGPVSPECLTSVAQEVMSGKSYTYSQVVDAVLKFGSNQWFGIGLKLGYNVTKIETAASGKPTAADKLQAIIELKRNAVDDKEVADLLLEACATIPQPIIGQVKQYLDSTYDPKAGVVTIEGSASEIQKPGAAPLVQPATRTSEADQEVKSQELVNVAGAIEGFWDDFAVQLDSHLFKMAGNIQAIKIDQNFPTPRSKAQVMLETWRDDKGKNATRRLLIETLCNMGKRKQANDVFGEFLTDFVQKRKTNVIDGSLPPDKQTEHSHATLTVKVEPQQPQSPMQVESAPDTTGNAGNKLTLDQLKLVGLGKGVKFMNLSPMKEIVTPDQNNIIRKPSVAPEIVVANDLEVSESEFAKELEFSFRTGVAQALHCSVLFMNDEHRSSKHRRSIHVAKVLSETVDLSDELPHSSSIPFVNSLKEAAEEKYPDNDLDDKQRDEICKDVIENVYQGTTHFISSVELGVMYSIVTEEKETTGGKKQNVSVSADIDTFIKAKLEGGVEIKREELEKKLNVKTLEKSIGIVGADGRPKETDRIGYKVSPIWSVIQDPDWKKSVGRVCSKILPVPVGEENPIVIKDAGSPPRYLKVSKVDNSAGGAKKQLTSKWRVERTATESEASKIYVVPDGKTNDGDGGTVISLNTKIGIGGQKIFLTPENGILAAKSCQSGKESKFVLVKPRDCDQTCDVREWQSRQPLCIRQAERKLTFPCFGCSSPQFVAFSTNEGSDSTPVMKTARDISSAEDWTSQFLIEPAI